MDWAKFDFQNAANAVVILLGFLLTALGVRNGISKRDEKPTEQVELAGAVIDKGQVIELVATVNQLVMTIDKHGRLFADIHEDLKEARTEIRDLIKEIIRASR